MYKSINIDTAAEHLKTIVDNNRCAVCDKIGGTRYRYACGHTSCESCIVLAAECSVCLTPPQSSSRGPVVDIPLTQRAANAVNLLSVFQNEFHIDVYKRQRISEQLKVEKEVFPECIQAPIKYSNKRKTFNYHNKENRLSQLPGEEITPNNNFKMEKQSENVELWLKKYVRKPFADLNSNDDRLMKGNAGLKHKQNNLESTKTPMKSSTRKRPHIKTALSIVKNHSLMLDHLTPEKTTESPSKKPRIENGTNKSDILKTNNTKFNVNATDNDESDIAMDDDDVIVIGDTQSIIVDKDMEAWLAVQAAEHNKHNTQSSDINTEDIEITPPNNKATEAQKLTEKVPFYLKSYLSHKCIDCNNIKHSQSEIETSVKTTNNTESASDISVTVENKSFIVIITVKQVDETPNKFSMQSVEVQTDKPESVNVVDQNVQKKNISEPHSQDIFQDYGKTFEHPNVNTNNELLNKQNVVIHESDSDEDHEPSVSLSVTAEIHRSCEDMDYGILSAVADLEEHSKRPRRGPRGITPTSSNSSEKENYNPNKTKKTPSSKKKPIKK